MLGVAAGWYEREFHATAVPFAQRGQIFERNLDMLYRLWDSGDVSGEWDGRVLSHVRMLPRPRPRPQVLIGGYVDRVLRRVGTRSDGWVTYFYTPPSIAGAWDRIRGYAEDAGRDPEQLNLVAQVPLCIGDSYEQATQKAKEYVGDYFDVRLERGHAGIGGPRHPRAVRRADRRLPRGGGRRGLREGGGHRGVERHLAFHLLHDLVDVAV